ncbi:hypothetical protein NG819_02895 [Pseudarthrobacter sp. Fe7]|nr:hypothetical protein NG819_02895 [Pseudarthrobacter sp. Fe7]
MAGRINKYATGDRRPDLPRDAAVLDAVVVLPWRIVFKVTPNFRST